jgi:hypothetical protein
MRMKRWISLAMAAVLALALAGIAIAHKNGGQPQPTKQVRAEFQATPDPEKTKTRQCEGVDGTYQITKVVLNGTSTGDAQSPELTGNLTIKAKTVVNTQTGLGWSDGKTFIRDAASGKLKVVAGFSAVLTGGNQLEGFVLGKVKRMATPPGMPKDRDNGHRRLKSTLRANFSATLNPDGSTAGGIGTGGGNNTAIIHGNPCAPRERSHEDDDKGDRHEGRDDDDDKGGRHEGRGDDDDRKGDDDKKGDDDRK